MRPIMVDCPMPIVSPRLLLRPPKMGYIDCYDYTSAVVDSINELRPWMPWASYPPTVELAEEYLRDSCANWIFKTNNNIGLPLFIYDRVSGVFVGSIIIHNIAWDVPRYEFGYWLKTAAFGKGYMQEAVNALARYCFLQLHARRIEIRCEFANVRSKKIPEALGFNFDALLKNNQISVATGAVTDSYVFSRTDLVGLPELLVKWGPGAEM